MPRERQAVRVLLLDPRERVLLFRGEREEDGVAFWFPPGGGLEGSESAAEAAAREVREETGLATLSLGPEVWRRRHVFSWRGVEWDQRERWFMARVPSAFVPARGGLTATESSDLKAARWWSLDELEATADELVPRALPSLLRALLRDGPPAAPIEVGV